ncbi:hypothetical protein EZV62_019503 [Acer yangbiense]|uniref:Glycosyltransferase n=1 Tax=Acer yangbiense TaxID=1000413 RepID=A0A5C7HBF0_9ROSI|nr:hypothetical protein EZV62_019503 [Acer yangbiense]
MSSCSNDEIWIVPFFGQGHLFPSMELCKQIASCNYKTALIISSNLFSNIPSSLRQYHPLLRVIEIPSSPPPPLSTSNPVLHHHPHTDHHTQMAQGLEQVLLSTTRPVCAIVDVMMSWTGDIFKNFGVATVGFFTSGACSAAMEHAMWKADLKDIKPGEIRLLPGLPEEMALTEMDFKRKPHDPPGGPPRGLGGPPNGPPGGPRGPPGGPSGGPPGGPEGPRLGFPGPPKRMGPPQLGGQPPWMEEVNDSIALMINTCHDLEGCFIDYLANQMGKPVWGVGPLLPEQFYKSDGSLVHDGEIRSNNRSNVTEDAVARWLDSKQRGSVLYVSFGTEVGPTMEDYLQLRDALEEASKWSFIWVIQPGAGRSGPPRGLIGEGEEDGYFPDGLDSKVGERGMIIRGWAPQLLILSHPSTGGFLSHCGWNSIVEAIGRGVPFLAWPIRGDQHFNAKLVIKHLRLGYMISNDLSKTIYKDDIINGVEKLMGDEDIKKRARILTSKFDHGFPATSLASLQAFIDFITHKPV